MSPAIAAVFAALLLARFPLPARAGERLAEPERRELVRAQRPELELRRGGILVHEGTLGADERTLLRRAEARSPGLELQRAGNIRLIDRDLQILFVAGTLALILFLVL